MAALFRVGYAGNPVRFLTSADTDADADADAANAVAVKMVQVQNREIAMTFESAGRRKT
jgi:hypothetical protein